MFCQISPHLLPLLPSFPSLSTPTFHEAVFAKVTCNLLGAKVYEHLHVHSPGKFLQHLRLLLMSSFLTISPHLSFLILPPPVCLLPDMIGPSSSPSVSSYSLSSKMLVLLRLTLSLFVPVSLYFFLGVQPLHWLQLLPTHCLSPAQTV